ncbi:MAG: extracellular solute-binding protein [Chloroflexi bacterium]|nr:extracellular solute-binding protein [Chloroflexota bacterium]MCC6891578.1 extracellular solute-binding protein [Anaerolineae bacterium]
MRKFAILLTLALMLLGAAAVSGQDAVELRITWYNDGTEGDALRAALDQFEAANPGITVVIDDIGYADPNVYHSTIQAQVESGSPPDLARVNDGFRFAGNYLDLTPLVADALYWTENFSDDVLNSLRVDANDTGIYGFPLGFTITAPFVNRTLFEQAGIEVPSDTKEDVTWEEWAEVSKQVADATGTPFAIAYEPRGHRFWGFAISEGGEWFNADGYFTADSEGFRTAAQAIIDWNQNGLSDPSIWANLPDGPRLAREQFINGQVVFLYSGSFAVGGLASSIADTFDWSAVPNPSGPGGSTGSPGGSLLVGFAGTQHPEEVAKLMDFLTQEDVLGEFSVKSSFLPGHLGLAAAGLEYADNAEILNQLSLEIPKIDEQAYKLQYSKYAFTYNRPIDNRLAQVIAGEITLDDAIAAIQKDVDDAIAATEAS